LGSYRQQGPCSDSYNKFVECVAHDVKRIANSNDPDPDAHSNQDHADAHSNQDDSKPNVACND
jgi:hypothetical protein